MKQFNIHSTKRIIVYINYMTEPSTRRKFNGAHTPIVILPETLHHERIKEGTGRQSKFFEDPEYYITNLLHYMSQGMTKEAASIYMRITPMTLWNWEQYGKEAEIEPKEERNREQHMWVEFLCALKGGEVLRQLWWEEKGRKGLHDKTFNAVLWMMNMSNLFKKPRDILRGEGWSPSNSKVEISGSIDHKHNVYDGPMDIKALDKKDKENLVSIIQKATEESADDRATQA